MTGYAEGGGWGTGLDLKLKGAGDQTLTANPNCYREYATPDSNKGNAIHFQVLGGGFISFTTSTDDARDFAYGLLNLADEFDRAVEEKTTREYLEEMPIGTRFTFVPSKDMGYYVKVSDTQRTYTYSSGSTILEDLTAGTRYRPTKPTILTD